MELSCIDPGSETAEVTRVDAGSEMEQMFCIYIYIYIYIYDLRRRWCLV